ncbi:MAG: outer membrane beta-barrel protein [Candidatus Electrothrix sp. GW3-4]|uniref:outer membrane beta-barrel protein n=1 Tax=Candidatus Electrothrix sp. GW3-4 TaxID=3126740 RepID=UPI0030CC87D0
MENRSKKYMGSALLILVSSHASFSGAQEYNKAVPQSASGLPMATVIYNDEMQATEPPVYKESQGMVGASASITEPEKEMVNQQAQSEEKEVNAEGRVFGYRNGSLHAALGLSGEWTDNLYNTDTEKEENFLTKISPSVWLTWPRRSRRPLQVAADNTAVGGLQYSQAEYDIYNKFELYLSGKMDFMTYSADSELDHAESALQGQAVYKPYERLTLRLMDNFSHSQDIFNIIEATSENNRVYDANVLNAGIDWRLSDKVSARIGYRNHVLIYDLELNNFMDRGDDGFDGALTYDYSPKTSFFVGGSLLTATYEENDMPDNDNLFLQAGMNWQATVKTGFMLKAGYQMVDYDEDWNRDGAGAITDTLNDGEETVHFEAQATWQATRKSEFLLNSKYNIEQSDSEYALNKTVWAARLAYGYRFTGRIRGTMNFIYEDSDYAQFDGSSRLDERWNLSPRIDFALKKWLSLTLYYNFDKKDSTFDELDYETNTLGIGVHGAF